MKTSILRYHVVIRKEDDAYIADVPTLGISDFGNSPEQAKENVQKAIECHVEGLIKTGTEVPKPDTDDYFISTTEVQVPFIVPTV
jgi:predicted RNase H-like HicB family nuclease